jgi:hypothetical protein
LQSIFNIAEAVDPTFHDITPESLWRKYLHKEIGDELAMPQGWFERTQAKAHQKPINEIVKEEMMNAEVDILLAKTLLVYERLNKFYK